MTQKRQRIPAKSTAVNVVTPLSFRERILAWVPIISVVLGLWGVVSPFVFWHLGQIVEARKYAPLLVAGIIDKPAKTYFGVSFVVPIINRGGGPAFKVRETHELDIVPMTQMDSDGPVPKDPSRAIGEVPALAVGDTARLQIDTFPPQEILDQLQPSGLMKTRVEMSVLYNDSAGKKHETRLCFIVPNPESAPQLCKTTWSSAAGF